MQQNKETTEQSCLISWTATPLPYSPSVRASTLLAGPPTPRVYVLYGWLSLSKIFAVVKHF